jgi:hypothetical protein
MIFLRNLALACSCLTASCAGEVTPPSDAADATRTGINVEVAEFDVSEKGIDRFLNCPPPPSSSVESAGVDAAQPERGQGDDQRSSPR